MRIMTIGMISLIPTSDDCFHFYWVLPEPISSSCRSQWCSACNCGSLGWWSSRWGRPPSPGWERSITVNRNIVWKPVVERWHVKDHLHCVEQTEQWLLHLARILNGENLMREISQSKSTLFALCSASCCRTPRSSSHCWVIITIMQCPIFIVSLFMDRVTVMLSIHTLKLTYKCNKRIGLQSV